jgi:hypothetical protein
MRFYRVNTKHDLHRQRVAWWLGLPALSGGRQLYNLISGKYHGVLSGGVWQKSPRGFDHLKFVNASNNYITVNSGFILGGQPAWSVAAWIVTTASNTAAGRSVYCERAASGNDILKMDAVTPTAPNAAVITYRNDPGGLVQVLGTKAINDGNWHHVVITYDPVPAFPTLNLYVDGVADGNSPFTGANPNGFTDASPSCLIGGDITTAAAAWDGLIDDVQLWSGRTLTLAEINQLRREGLAGYPTMLREIVPDDSAFPAAVVAAGQWYAFMGLVSIRP